VAEVHEFTSQVPGVDALTAAARVAAVYEKGNAKFARSARRAGTCDGVSMVLERAHDAWFRRLSELGSGARINFGFGKVPYSRLISALAQTGHGTY